MVLWFDSVAWWDCETAFKILSKNIHVNISKACFNLWHTGHVNVRYYGGGLASCVTQEEDWIYTLTCQSIDACMNWEESWAKVRKEMKHWKLPNDFWTAMEKCLDGY
jgi:hypothetical protein